MRQAKKEQTGKISQRNRNEYFEKYVNKATQKLTKLIEYEKLLDRIAPLFVPGIADWCVVTLFDDFGNLQTVDSLHKNKTKKKILQKLHTEYHLDERALYKRFKNFANGKSELFEKVTPDILTELPFSKKQLADVKRLGITSAMIIPLIARNKTFGAVILVCSDPNTSFDKHAFRLSQELGNRVALSLDNARLVMLEKQSRMQTEETMIRIHKLQQITAALSKATTPKQVASVILSHGLKALGANAGSVCLLDSEEKTLRILRMFGYEKTVMKTWQNISLDLKLPLVDAVKQNKTILVSNKTILKRDYPEVFKKLLPQNSAFIAAPLTVGNKTIGAIGCSFKNEREFSLQDKVYLSSVVNQCSIALERSLLFDAERKAKAQAVRELQSRQLAQEELKISEERFRGLFELAPDAIYNISNAGKFIQLNPAFERITGFSIDEWVGRSYKELIFKEDLKRARAVFSPSDGIESYTPYELRVKTKSGQLIVCEFRSKTREKRGRTIGTLGIFRDISLRKQEEKERNYMLGIASHELKTPLATIKAFSQILKKRLQKEEGQDEKIKYVDRIDQHVNRLTKLIGDMLDITRIRAGKIELKEDIFDIDELISDVVSDLQTTVESHKLRVKGKADTYIQADKDRISRVLLNLLSNAVKYSPKANEVIVTIHSTKKTVGIDITDFGIGIPNNMKERVFEPFTHIQTKTRGSIPSVGLGLYISSQLTRSHGGKIWFETEVGKGSTFHIQLPIKRT